MAEPPVIGKPKVLVLAYRELAESIGEALKDQADCQWSKTGDASPTDDLPWLCSQIFPSGGQVHSDAELFRWGRYDFIIIQDLWLGAQKEKNLKIAGYVLADLDYYQRGNFHTKKVLLVGDAEFFLQGTDCPPKPACGSPDTLFKVMKERFDNRRAFDFVHLTGPEPGAVRILRDVVTRKHPADAVTNITQDESHQMNAMTGAMPEALRRYVLEQASVIIVDDELPDLKETFEAVTGNSLKDKDLKPGQAHMVCASRDGHATKQAPDFEKLLEECKKEFRAVRGPKGQVIFVTDILFNLPNWDKTGVDLIQEVHDSRRGVFDKAIGIVAYTNFSTPFISMSAHQRGADFVVLKETARQRRHGFVETAGTDRLLITLAFLCFQKQFLRQKRSDCNPGGWGASKDEQETFRERARKAAEEMKRVLPRHAVSLHILQEWQDTVYLLEAARIYGPKGRQLDQAWADLREKYDRE